MKPNYSSVHLFYLPPRYDMKLHDITCFTGHLKEAEVLMYGALDIHTSILGAESTHTAVTMNNLGVLLTHLGRLDEVLHCNVLHCNILNCTVPGTASHPPRKTRRGTAL